MSQAGGPGQRGSQVTPFRELKGKGTSMIQLEDETLDAVRASLRCADTLCSAVISGSPNLMKLALELARALGDKELRKLPAIRPQ